jgi:histidine triad (HIT) family protein
MAFRDINPQGPVHFLVIPKNKDGLNKLSSAREDHKSLLVCVQ